MIDAGYTLVEMLVALAIIGLTIGGLAESTRVMGRLEAQGVHGLQGERAYLQAQQALEGVLKGRGPFRSDQADNGLQGSDDEFDFPCGDQQCGARIGSAPDGTSLILDEPNGSERIMNLRAIKRPIFAYYDDAGERADWPPSEAHAVLRSIAILDEAESVPRPVAMARVEIEQAADCEFDPIIRDCRSVRR